jgi:hypothetical protein
MKMLFLSIVALAVLAGCQQTSVSAVSPDPPDTVEYTVQEVDFLGPELSIDGIYPSMRGPAGSDLLALKPNSDELGWMTGFKSVMVGADGKAQTSQEYMCHTNLDLEALEQHIQPRGIERFNPGRLFTISQGQQEVVLPHGFGIPIRMGQPMAAAVQALNLNNHEIEEALNVRHKLTFRFVEDSKVKGEMIPLFTKSGVVLKALEEENVHYGADHQDEMAGGGCLVGNPAVDDGKFEDENGHPFTPHWVVNKGVEKNQTVVTEMLDLPYDTTIHYILAHVHPFCESLELRDLTTGESVVKLEMKQESGKIGLSHTEHFQSVEGLPLYKDHAYEMLSVYNNTSDKDQDAMAVMIFFLKDKTFSAERYLEKTAKPRI